MKRLGELCLSLAISALILTIVLQRFDGEQSVNTLREAQPGLLVLGVALMILAYAIRGARWTIWERSLSYGDSIRLILIGFMGNNVLPARLGELLRAHCAAAKTSDGRGRTTALASIVAERVLDGMTLGIFGVLGILLVPLDSWFKWALLTVSLAFAILTTALLAGIWLQQSIRAAILRANQRFPGHVTAFAGEKLNYFLDGLLSLRTLPRMMAAIASTFVIWGIEIGCCYFIGLALWPRMDFGAATIFLVVANFASLFPLTMGGVGTVEAATTVSLINCGIPHSAALAMVLLQHGTQYFFTTISGAAIYLAGRFHKISLAQPKGGPAVSTDHLTPRGSDVVETTRSELDRLGRSMRLRPASPRDVQLSIIIPAYNEQARLPRTVLETMRWCTGRHLSFEIIVVDDGSHDETLSLARLFEESDRRIRALACPHAGKGATVRMGMLNARGHVALFMDADGATPLDEIPKLLGAIDRGYDVAIGSRVAQRPGEVDVRTSLHRRLIGRVFALFVNLLAVEGIADTQCGFKMFRRDAAMAVFSRQKLVGFAFDVEILFIARQLALAVVEIPVNWVAQPGSKVNIVTDSIRMLRDISRIRWLHRTLTSAGAPEVTVARMTSETLTGSHASLSSTAARHSPKS